MLLKLNHLPIYRSPVAQPPAQKSSNPLIESTANALAILLSNSGPPSESHPAPVEPSGPVDPTQLAIQRAKEVTTNLKQHMQPAVKVGNTLLHFENCQSIELNR